MGRKFTYDEVCSYYEEHGCKLLEKDYINNRTKMNFLCSCGEEYSTTFGRFKNGVRCKNCSSKRAWETRGKKNIEDVKLVFSNNGCELLENEYIDCNTPLEYVCECGNISKTTLKRFENGSRCNECANKKRSESKKRKLEKIKVEGREVNAKTCNTCGTLKSLTDYHKLKSGVGGRQSKCKSCKKIISEKYRRNLGQKEKVVARVGFIVIKGEEVEAKECSECKVMKQLDDFQKSCGGLKGRTTKCRNCNNKTSSRSFKSEIREITINSEIVTQKKCNKCDSWKQTTDFRKGHGKLNVRAECKVCEKEYWEENRDKTRKRGRENYQKNKEKYSEYGKKFREENPDKIRLQVQRRLAWRRSLPNDIEYGDFQKIKRDFKETCALTDSKDIHIDHFIPLSWGHGGTIKGNLFPLDSKLNVNKSNKNPIEWFKEFKEDNDLKERKWRHLLNYLAKQLSLSVSEFIDFIYWCEENKRDVKEVQSDDRSSVEIWKDTKAMRKLS